MTTQLWQIGTDLPHFGIKRWVSTSPFKKSITSYNPPQRNTLNTSFSPKPGPKSTQFQHIYGSSLPNFGLILKNGVAIERGTQCALVHIIKYCHCLLGASRRRCKKVTLDGKRGRQLWRPFSRSRRLNSTKNYHIKNLARPLADKKIPVPRHLAPIVEALECRV